MSNPVGGPGTTGATTFVLIDAGGVQLQEIANLLELVPVAAGASQQLGHNGSGKKTRCLLNAVGRMLKAPRNGTVPHKET